MFLQEGVTSHDENMRYLNLAVGAFQKVQTLDSRRDGRPAKRDSGGQTLEKPGSFTLPFGPNLTPVLCPRGAPPERRSPDSGGALSRTRPRDCADGSPENSAEDLREAGSRSITTNDLLDCLVHPDVVARVTELLLDRYVKKTSTHTHTHQQTQSYTVLE